MTLPLSSEPNPAACPQSYVADDGCLHVVAERSSIRDALARLDLPRARLLTRLSLFWVRRVRFAAQARGT